jgi:predicted nucleic acid-binding protein
MLMYLSTWSRWASLGYETLTTQMVAFELRAGEHTEALAYIDTNYITVLEPQTEEVEMLRSALGHSVSTQDASVLFIAIQNQALLLTGDKRLRMNAELLEIECHGSIWILEQLVANGQLSGRIAAEKLQNLVSHEHENPRYLPKQIVRECIRRWRAL